MEGIANHPGVPARETGYCLEWLSIYMLLAKAMPKIEEVADISSWALGLLEMKNQRRGLTEGDMVLTGQPTTM
jgi:hypothetical protein